MGCIYSRISDDVSHMRYYEFLARDIAVVKNRIKAKKLPIIWMDGEIISGLHTHGLNIAGRFEYKLIDIEQMLRDEENKNTDRAKLVRQKFENQGIVPDKVIMDLLKEKMIEAGDTAGYLITGFPRTSKQAMYFLKDIGMVDCIIMLEGIKLNTGFRNIETGDRKIDLNRQPNVLRDIKFGPKSYDTVVEKIATNEDPAKIFLRIEAAILDRLSPK